MDITVEGRHTVTRAPERATIDLHVETESGDRSGAVSAALVASSLLAGELEGLTTNEPAPVTWCSTEALATSSSSPHSSTGEVLPARHAARVRMRAG